jgi:hypothetical protein
MRRPADATRTPARTDARATSASTVEPRVVPASGVYRAVMIILAAWTIFEGLALATQGVPALSLGGGNAAERIIGAQMLMLVPVYALIVWRPEEYRYLRWIPYAAQIAIVLPMFWDVLITGDQDFTDGALLFVVSAMFLGVLIYLRTSTHPLAFFTPDEPEDDALDEEDEDLVDDADLEEEEDEEEPEEPQPRGRRYRRNG